jgi:hypothetical protein
MKTKAKIKVIRKKELAVEMAAKSERIENGDKSARKMVTNVSSWVNDFQKRKRAETKEAIEMLFPSAPQTDSV